MEWYWALLFLVGSVVALIMCGIPVAFAFLAANIAGAMVFMGGLSGLIQVFDNTTSALSTFSLVPVPLFILMGGLFFNSGLAQRTFDGLDVILGRVPGRLSLLAVGGGTAFAALTGASMANTAMMGSMMIPEMKKRGYSNNLSMGPILATGGLAIVIPPSAPAVVLGSMAMIDIGALLIAGIGPGLLLALLFCCVIAVQIIRNPDAAPAYDVPKVSVARKLAIFSINILPMMLVILLVVATILFGIATPTESAAFGVLAVLVLAAVFRTLSLDGLIKSVESAILISGMTFFIIVGSLGFSQIVAYSGASRGLVEWALGFDVTPYTMVIIMLLILMIMGMFVDLISMILLTVPTFFPVATALGIDPILFGMLVLVTLEMGLITPPFGLSLFIMRGVAPEGTTMGDVTRAALPYVLCDIAVIALLLAFPAIALFLPSLMR